MAKITKIEATTASRVRKIRVAAYARVSTDSDEQLLSLETQKAHYEEYIKSNPEWEYAGLYYDEGISGTKVAKRDSLLRLLEDCEAGKIDRVITKSISRFARNTVDCLEMVRRLSQLKITMLFEKENIDTEHMSSELMLSILSSIAESESRSISQNEKWSIKHRFENGTFIIAYPPYGYENKDGQMVVIPEEAEVVKDIFRMALSGMGCHLIAAELNHRGLHTKRSGKWHSSSVQGILKNEKYTGDVIFQKTFTDEGYNRHTNYGEEDMFLHKNHHEAIISHEDFEKAAEAMQQRKTEKGIVDCTGKYQVRYSFSGRLICGECGGTFKRRTHYKPSGDYIAWACTTHLEDKYACGMKYVEDEQIKAAFIRMVAKLHVGSSVVLKPFMSGLLDQKENKEKLSQLGELDQQIEEFFEQQRILVQLMSSGYIEPGIFYQEKHDLEIQVNELMAQKDALANNLKGDLRHLDEASKLMKAVSKTPSAEFDGELFEAIVDTATIVSRETIRFNLKCGLQLEERMVKA